MPLATVIAEVQAAASKGVMNADIAAKTLAAANLIPGTREMAIGAAAMICAAVAWDDAEETRKAGEAANGDGQTG